MLVMERLNRTLLSVQHSVCFMCIGCSWCWPLTTVEPRLFWHRESGRGWEIAHAAVSRRPPIPISRIVARTEGYTHAAKVWDLSIVQGPFSVAPCQTLIVRFVTFASL